MKKAKKPRIDLYFTDFKMSKCPLNNFILVMAHLIYTRSPSLHKNVTNNLIFTFFHCLCVLFLGKQRQLLLQNRVMRINYDAQVGIIQSLSKNIMKNQNPMAVFHIDKFNIKISYQFVNKIYSQSSCTMILQN